MTGAAGLGFWGELFGGWLMSYGEGMVLWTNSFYLIIFLPFV